MRTCKTETRAYFITQNLFHGSLFIAGCILAFMTRNIGSVFGEAKQLLFVMYNFALLSLIVLLMEIYLDIDRKSLYVIKAIGVFWATVSGTCAFVLPRLLQVKRQAQMRRNSNSSSSNYHTSMPSYGISNRSSFYGNSSFGDRRGSGRWHTPTTMATEPSSSNTVGSTHVCEFQVKPIQCSTKSLAPFPDTKETLQNDGYISGGDDVKPNKEGKNILRKISFTKQSIGPLETEALQELAR